MKRYQLVSAMTDVTHHSPSTSDWVPWTDYEAMMQDVNNRIGEKDAEIKALKASIAELDHKYARALSDLVAQRQEG